MDSFPKTTASLNSYRNARITTTFLTSWTLHILYDISHWQLRILTGGGGGGGRRAALLPPRC